MFPLQGWQTNVDVQVFEWGEHTCDFINKTSHDRATAVRTFRKTLACHKPTGTSIVYPTTTAY